MKPENLDNSKTKMYNEAFVLNLPIDRSFSSQSRGQLAEAELIFPESINQSIEWLYQMLEPSRSREESLLILFLALYSIILSRYSGQTEIVLGTSSISDLSTAKQVSNSFLNSPGIRVFLEPLMTFRQLLKQVQETVKQVHDYQNSFCDKSTNLVACEQDSFPAPFQVFLGLMHSSKQDGFAEMNLSQAHVDAGTNHEMALWVLSSHDRLCLRAVYKSELFSNLRIQFLLDQLQGLLEGTIGKSDEAIESYSLLTSESIKLLPNPRRPMFSPGQDLVANQFLKQAAIRPDELAIQQKERRFTYGKLRRLAEVMARVLVFEGLQRGEVIAIYGSRSCGLIASVLGVLLGGGAFLLVDPNLPLHRMRIMLEQAEVRSMVLLSGSPTPDLSELSLRYLRVEADSGKVDASHLTEFAWTRDFPDVQADDPAYVFFTSGTTGTPKGILGIQKSLAHFINWLREEFAIDRSDRCAQLTAISFDVILRDIFLPLTSGAAICIPEQMEMSPVQTLNWLRGERITAINIVPTLAQFWLDYASANYALDSLRWVFFGGEPLTEQLVNQWQTKLVTKAKLINFYGPTETCLAKCYHPVSEDLHTGIQPIGRPIPHAQALVLSSDNRLCGIGEIGEIAIRTPFRTSGYLSLSTDKKCFEPNPFTEDPEDLIYRTGDLGRYHPLGILEILGRSDDQVKINGVRVEPAEITAVLSKHPSVRSCIVLPIRSTERLPYLTAYVVASTDNNDNDCRKELKAFLAQELPAALIPSVFAFVPELPRKINGKVDRHALPAPNRQFETAEDVAYAPRNLAERRLASIWERILDRDSINFQDDFFDLGGTSLQALYLVAEIERQFGLTFSVDVLLEAPTLEQLAAKISTGGVSTGAYVALVSEGTKSPLFCVSGTGGHVFRLRPFAVRLMTDQPVLGLHFPGIDGRERPRESVEGVAAAMIEKVRAKQPHGPYYLAGYSYGGLVCYEMAQQLTATGERIGLLALLDTSPYLPIVADYNEKLLALIKAEEEEEVFVFDHLRKILEANEHAERIYSPPVDICGKVALFRTDQSYTVQNSPTLGWDRLVPSGIAIYPVTGTHDTMVEEPHAQILAENVRIALLKELEV